MASRVLLLISLPLMAISRTTAASNGDSGSEVTGVAWHLRQRGVLQSSTVEDQPQQEPTERLLIAYMNCNQPGPTPGCRYHPYWNTVTPTNTTMDPYQQLQISSGQAHGIASASAFDVVRQLMYFFLGDEQTIYTIVAGPTAIVLPPITLNVTELGGSFFGVNMAHCAHVLAANHCC